jgi:antitoxin PrlF
MKNVSTISSKGQVTVPRGIRDRLGLSAGDQVEFAIDGDRTVIRPARSTTKVFARYKGVLPAFSGKEQINSWVDELRTDERPRQRRGRK